eukprot:NODE_151_length_3005_cov_38.347091_g139_i0.p1 GENE.NODE_151_length_3005_cov_38.347091_g139_i0~~NODE_151_length_3005_cov_38.347091_g139_i0.p1  ORF type:complete len:945 (-),score=186.96 NODE_151_length_3005_cov_38.347091_g139_i0:171-2729(-)
MKMAAAKAQQRDYRVEVMYLLEQCAQLEETNKELRSEIDALQRKWQQRPMLRAGYGDSEDDIVGRRRRYFNETATQSSPTMLVRSPAGSPGLTIRSLGRVEIQNPVCREEDRVATLQSMSQVTAAAWQREWEALERRSELRLAQQEMEEQWEENASLHESLAQETQRRELERAAERLEEGLRDMRRLEELEAEELEELSASENESASCETAILQQRRSTYLQSERDRMHERAALRAKEEEELAQDMAQEQQLATEREQQRALHAAERFRRHQEAMTDRGHWEALLKLSSAWQQLWDQSLAHTQEPLESLSLSRELNRLVANEGIAEDVRSRSIDRLSHARNESEAPNSKRLEAAKDAFPASPGNASIGLQTAETVPGSSCRKGVISGVSPSSSSASSNGSPTNGHSKPKFHKTGSLVLSECHASPLSERKLLRTYESNSCVLPPDDEEMKKQPSSSQFSKKKELKRTDGGPVKLTQHTPYNHKERRSTLPLSTESGSKRRLPLGQLTNSFIAPRRANAASEKALQMLDSFMHRSSKIEQHSPHAERKRRVHFQTVPESGDFDVVRPWDDDSSLAHESDFGKVNSIYLTEPCLGNRNDGSSASFSPSSDVCGSEEDSALDSGPLLQSTLVEQSDTILTAHEAQLLTCVQQGLVRAPASKKADRTKTCRKPKMKVSQGTSALSSALEAALCGATESIAVEAMKDCDGGMNELRTEVMVCNHNMSSTISRIYLSRDKESVFKNAHAHIISVIVELLGSSRTVKAGEEWPMMPSDIARLPEHHRTPLIRSLQELVIAFDMMSTVRRATMTTVVEVLRNTRWLLNIARFCLRWTHLPLSCTPKQERHFRCKRTVKGR